MYPYEYNYDPGAATSAAAGIAGFLLAFVLVIYLLMFGFLILTYVLESLGMYTIAKRRGIHHSWLSWVPVGNMWLLGSISDQYQYVVKGRVRNRRKVLLGLSIGMCALIVFMYIGLFAVVFSEAAAMDPNEMLFGGAVAVMLLCYLAILVLAIIAVVFQYMALYDLFASCDPGNAVLYLVLSIFLGVTLPFFVFTCRNKDLGMIPKQQPTARPAPQQIPEPVQEEHVFNEPQPEAVPQEPEQEA